MTREASAIFLDELGERLESLERALLDLRSDPDNGDLVDQAFRDLHTIKGSGAMFGHADLASFVHDFESAFQRVRDGKVRVTDGLIRLAMEACDEIPALVSGEPGREARRQAILAAVHGETGEAPQPPNGPSAPDADTAPAPHGWRLHLALTGQSLALGTRPDLILDELRQLGAQHIVADLTHLPALQDLDPGACHIRWHMTLPPGDWSAALDEVFLFCDADWRLEPVDTPPAQTMQPAEAAPMAPVQTGRDGPAAPAAGAPAALVRVPAERLDALMDAVGELVIAEARLAQLTRRARDPAVQAVSEHITRLASGLRDTAMTLRMVPLATMVPRFRRLVADLSDKLGKPVDFTISGEETELDKTLIDRLGDPLLHVLRNALDHGLEPPAARRALGKPERGSLHLSAEQSGSDVLIRVRDDGGGIDLDRVRAKAIARGLITPDAQPGRAQLLALLFEAGFSTVDKVTELSGRGVGMDVVRRSIEGMRGSVSLDSTPGAGTELTLRLPLTLAIIDTLLIEAGGERYLLPLSAVQEIVALPPGRQGGARTEDHLDVRGRFVPFLRLHDLLDCRAPVAAQPSVVIVRHGEDRIGLVVDRVLQTRQTVIKQMSRLHAGLRGIVGATILGDGSVALVLDVPGLLSLGRSLPGRPDRGAAA